jgi:glutamine synthetase
MDTVNEIDPAHAELLGSLQSQGVEFVMGGWIDVLGRSKAKVVPIDHLPNMLAGSERYTPRGMGGLGRMDPVEDESVAMPDPATMQILPWDRRFAWMAADLLAGGTTPFALCPRSILKRQVAAAADAGFTMFLGIEPELYVFRPDQVGPDGYLEPVMASGKIRPTQAYDVESAMDAMAFLEPMSRYLTECGYGLFSLDAEGGDGQYEFDFGYFPVLEMADKLTLFKLMVRAAAKDAGLVASFMPKPYLDAWGSGHHFNMSLGDVGTGQNLFRDADDVRGAGWSKLAYSFTAGIMRHAGAIAAVATPTVNSYKRLTSRLTDGNISWAPTFAAYGDNNRSCMMRLPHNRPAVENRAVDSAVNPYLAAAFMLAAGLEGIREQLDPGDPIDELTYDWSGGSARGALPPNATRLPRTLLEAVDAFEDDPLTREVFSDDFVDSYVDMKRGEWDDFHCQITPWERDAYLLNL